MLKTILKLLFSIILLITAGYFVYNNFVNKKQIYIPPKTFEDEQVYNKFDLDVLEDKVFKELIQAQLVENKTNSKEDIGRANPFISF